MHKKDLIVSLPRASSLIAASIGVVLAISPAVHASSLSWTSAGSSTLGGTGTWDTSGSNWWNGTSAQAWSTNTTSGDTAVFAGTAGTVTLGTNINALGLQFTTTGYTLALGGNTLALGSGGINASTLTSGTTAISGGTLNIASGYQSWSVGSGGTLSVGSTVTRSTGAAVNFSTTGTINTTGSGLANTNGVLGGWATVGNGGGSGATADWAALDGSGNIVTYTGYTDVASGNQTGAGASTQNWRTVNTGASTSLTTSATINSLVVRSDFSVSSGATMTLGDGGLILSGVSRWILNNGTGSTAGTGQLTTGLASGELFIDVASSTSDASNWRIWTKIVDNGGTALKVVKNGPGLVWLSNSNSYTGATYVNGGTLIAANGTNPFGTNAALYLNGGSIANEGSVTLAKDITISGTGNQVWDNSTAGNLQWNGTLNGNGSLTVGNNGSNISLYTNFTNNMTGGTITFANNTNVMRIQNTSVGNANVAWVFNNTTSGKDNLEFNGGTISFGSLTGNGYITGNAGNGTTQTISVGNLNLNDTFSGIINQNGTDTISLTKVGTGTLTLSGANAYTGTTTINGGKIALGSANAIGTSGNIVFGGGTLQYSASNTTDYSARIASGTSTGAVAIDTNGQNVTFATALTANQSGGLAKSGTGTLTLSANNLLTGTKTVTGGTLALTGSGQLNGTGGITINGSGAKFVQSSSVAVSPAVTLTQGTIDGTGTINSVTVANLAGNTIQNGNGGTSALTIGSLTFNGAATINLFDTGSATTPVLNITGTLTTTPANGQVTINASAGAWSNTTFNLISYGTFGGSLSDFTTGTISGLNSRQSATLGLDSLNKYITLTISGDSPVWTGSVNGDWNTATANWKLITGGTSTTYIQGDAVLFDDSATGSTAVNISAVNVAPTTTTFNNSSKDYTVSSTGGFGITGGSLTKSGTGTLTISTANTYSGGTNVNGGTLALSGSGTLGSTSGAVAMGGGKLDLGGTSQTTGAVTITAAAASGNTIQNGTLTASSVTASNASGNVIVASNLIGSGSVTMSGAGTLTLSGTNTYSGGTFVKNGTTVISSGASISSTTGALTLGDGVSNTSGILQLGDSNGAATATVGGLATAGTGTANAVVGGNSSVSTLTVNNSSAATYGGLLGGVGANQNNLALVKSGAGALTLSGANTYTGGTTVNAGTVVFGNSSAFGTGAVTLSGGGLKAAGGYTLANNIAVTSTSTFDMAGNNTGLSGSLSGSGALNFTTSGFASTLTLSGNNSGYSGTVTINTNNAVSFNAASAGSAGAAWVFNDGNIDRVRINVGTNTINFGSIAGSGQIQNDTSATTATLSVGALGTDTTFSGTIKDNGTGKLALTKVGTGSLTLSGSNAYSAGTTVSAGTLVAANSSALGSGDVTVGGGALQSSVANVGGLGNVSMTSGSLSINTGGVGTLTLATGKTFTMSGGTWNLDLAALDSIVGTSTSTFSVGGTSTFALSNVTTGTYNLLTSFQTTGNTLDVTNVNFTGLTGGMTASLSQSAGVLTLTVVPEPHEFAIAIVALLGVLVFIRRRNQQA